MKACLIDSSAFLSLEDPSERSHDATREALETLVEDRVPLVTTNFVFDEAYTLVLVRLGRDRAIGWGESVRASRTIRRVRVSRAHEEGAWELLLRYEDKAFSHTDATSFAVAEALGVDGALSLDEHFHRYGRLEVVP